MRGKLMCSGEGQEAALETAFVAPGFVLVGGGP